MPFRDSNMCWHIETPYWIKDKRSNNKEAMWYNEDTDEWYTNDEQLPWTSSAKFVEGPLTKKNIYNMVRKWKLPKGTQMIFSASWRRYVVTEYLVTVI